MLVAAATASCASEPSPAALVADAPASAAADAVAGAPMVNAITEAVNAAPGAVARNASPISSSRAARSFVRSRDNRCLHGVLAHAEQIRDLLHRLTSR